MKPFIDYNKQVKKYQQPTRNDNKETLQLPARVLLIGPSNCGKTTLLQQFIFNEHWRVSWDRIYLLCKTIDEPLYAALIDTMTKNEDIIEEKTGERPNLIEYSDDLAALPDLKTIDKTINNIFIFDDQMNSKDKVAKDTLIDYAIRGRKCGVSFFYLAQRMAQVDRTIRLNCNVCILFQFSSATEGRTIAQEWAGILPPEAFIEVYKNACSKRHNFLLIDTTKDPEDQFYHGDTTTMRKIDISKYLPTKEEKEEIERKKEKASVILDDGTKVYAISSKQKESNDAALESLKILAKRHKK